MALSPKLLIRQSQTLAMTPQLMQAIKLLQYSSLDLAAYIEAELERNPLLERDEREERDEGGSLSGDEPQGSDSSDDSATGFEDAAGPAEVTDDWDDLETDARRIADNLDTGAEDAYPEDPSAQTRAEAPPAVDSWAGVGSGGSAPEGGYDIEAFVSQGISLADHLAGQMSVALSEPVDRMIGRYLIDSLDDAGYLRTDLETVAEQLGISITQVEEVLAILQTFEPAGVFARSLGECLALQLRERDRYDPAMAALIDNIELLGRRDFAALKRLCGVDDEDLADMFEEIRSLDPKPGHSFGGDMVQPVVPDVTVRQGPDGGWIVELNSDTLPRVLVSQTYYSEIARTASGTDKTFLSDCLQTANWLVKSLDQRAKTILKVASEIVRQQDAFLMHGVQHLKPLNLKTVADAIEMHESTVSRVTSNKYMATPRGVFELKYFFTSAISAAGGGEAHSAEAVRDRIRRLIDAEPPTAILSDDAIVAELRDAGVDIARRTVAKYREAMRIPSSVQRRREKRALAGGS